MGSAFCDSEVTRQDMHTGRTALLGVGARALGAPGQAACGCRWWAPMGLGLGLGAGVQGLGSDPSCPAPKSQPQMTEPSWKLSPGGAHPSGDSSFLVSSRRLSSEDSQGCVSRLVSH